MDNIELDFVTNLQSTIGLLTNLNSQLGVTLNTYNNLRGNNPFQGFNQNVIDTNRLLADGSRIYQTLRTDAASYRDEIKRLTEVERGLIRTQAEFANSANYDEIQADLVNVRNRLSQVREALRGTGSEGEEAGRRTSRGMKEAKTATDHFNDALKSAKTLVLGFFALNQIKQWGVEMFSARSNMESFGIALETMVQSREEAQKLEIDIVKKSLTTPFTLQEVQEQSKKLLAYGIAAKDVVKDISTLGDISAGVGKDKLPQLTLAFGQVRAIGRLMGSELRQFTEAGVPLLDELAKQAGKSTAIIQDEMSRGKISFEQVKMALTALTEEGGRFYNLMEKQSTTIEGKWSNVSDSLYQGFARVGKSFDGSAKGALDWAKSLIDSLVGSDSAIQRTMSGLKTAIGVWITYRAVVALATTQTRLDAIAKAQNAVATGTATAAEISLASANRTLFVSTGLAITGVSGLRASITALWTAMRANPLGIVLTGLSLLYTAYQGLKTVTSDVTSAVGEQVVALANEQVSLNGLVNSIKNTKEGTQERLILIKKLKDEYPDFLKGIKDEDVLNQLLDKRLVQVNNSYKERIMLAELAYKQEQALNDRKAQLDKDRALEQRIRAENPELQNVFGLENLQKAVKAKEANQYEKDGLFKTIIKDLFTVEGLNDNVAAGTIGKQLEESNKNRLRTEKEIEFYTTETAKRQKQTTDEKEKQHKLDLQTIKDLGSKKNLTPEQKANLDLATINETLYKAANPAAPKSSASQADIDKANNLKDKNEKALLSEQEKLQKLQKDFEEKLNDIRLEAQNVRLSELEKQSKEYIEAKKKYDLEVIKSEESKFKELFNIQNGKTTLVSTNRDGEKTYKNLSFTESRTQELVNGGASKEAAEKQAKEELDQLYKNSDKTLAIRQLISEKENSVIRRASKETLDLVAKENEYLISIKQKNLESEIEQIEYNLKKQLEIYKGNEYIQKQLIENAEREKLEITAKYGEEQVRTKEEFTFAEIDLIKREVGESQVDFERRIQRERLEAQIKFAQDRLNVETKYFEDLLTLEAAKKVVLTDSEKELQENRIKLLSKQIAEFKDQLLKMPTLGLGNKDIWDLFGVTFDKADADKNDKIKEIFNNAVVTVKDALSEILDIEIKSSQDRISVFDDLISKRQSQLNDELSKQKEGLANSADAKQKEVEALKKSREDELEHQKKVRKSKAIVEAAEIAGNQAVTISTMIRSAADVFGGFAKIPLGVGIILGIAAVASLYGAFKSVQSKFKAANEGATKLRKGKRLSKGSTHEQGGMNVYDNQTGDLLYEIEKEEWLMGSKPSKEHNELLGHINDDSLRQVSQQKQRELLKPLGIKFLDDSQKKVSQHYETVNKATPKVSELSLLDLDQIAKHTARIPKQQKTYLGNGLFLIEEEGKTYIEENLYVKNYEKQKV